MLTSLQTQAQPYNSISPNSSGSNSSGKKNTWVFSFNPGMGFVVNSHATPGVNRITTNLSSQYYFGNVGLGITGGIASGSMSSDAINTFLSGRNYPSDATITKSNPSNSYLLFGPAVKFGNKVQFGAELSGGLFLNNTGSLIVTPQGAPRPLYSMQNGDKNLYPGFSSNIHIDYPINNSTRFFISGGYLQTKSSNRILDVQQGIDIPRLQNQDVKLFMAGIGISKTFGGRRVSKIDAFSIRQKRERKGSNRIGILVDDDFETSIIKYPFLMDENTDVVSKRKSNNQGGVESLLATLIRSRVAPKRNLLKEESESCGPVTQKTTNPDGTVTEIIFACPQDAAQFQQRSNSLNSLNNSMPSRLSMTPTTARQTQGLTFGEKVQQGLHQAGVIHSDLTARNIIMGKISRVSGNVAGIETNETISATAKKHITGVKYEDISARLYARESGSGMATGRRQYQLVYSDDADSTIANADISINPLYQSTGNSGDIPLFEANNKSKSSGGGDLDKDGIPEIMVSLIDPVNDAVLATTKTEANGDFFFANLPSGPYTLKVEGRLISKKGYDVYLKNKTDVAGQLLSGDVRWSIELITGTGTAEQAATVVKTKTKSNSTNDRLMNTTDDNSGIVWDPQTIVKMLPVSIGDADDDGLGEMLVGNNALTQGASLLGGALGGNFASRPGNPIGGIIVKGGKNPGGSFFTTTTNNNGEFEFSQLKAGDYKITVEQNIIISDETLLQVGDGADDVTSQKNVGGSDFNKIETTPVNDSPESNKEKKKVVEKATSGLKDTLKTNVLVKPDSTNSGKDVKSPKVNIEN